MLTFSSRGLGMSGARLSAILRAPADEVASRAAIIWDLLIRAVHEANHGQTPANKLHNSRLTWNSCHTRFRNNTHLTSPQFRRTIEGAALHPHNPTAL